MRNPVPENGTILRAVSILHALKADRAARGVRLTELAQQCGLEKSTTHRLLSTLVAEGLVEQDPDTERYRLGITLLELGMAVYMRLDIREEAQPVLRSLSERAHETIHLGVARGGHVVYLDKVESLHAFQMRSRVGERMPLYSTGIGKAILAFLSEAELAAVIAAGLERRAENTITDPVELRAEMQRIRARGYSTDLEENEEGVRCVAAPIFDHRMSIAGAISIAGPAFRFPDVRMSELADHVVAAAQEVSQRLGCTASPYAIRT
jgi:IclR family transcriptional regulator, KDG regulon repressor